MGATGFAYSRFFEMMGLEFVDLYCDDCIVCLAQGLLGTLFHPTHKKDAAESEFNNCCCDLILGEEWHSNASKI